jgi:hypothetical protein
MKTEVIAIVQGPGTDGYSLTGKCCLASVHEPERFADFRCVVSPEMYDALTMEGACDMVRLKITIEKV